MTSVDLESLERCVGVTVSVTVTYQKEPIIGEIVAFDRYSQTLILRCLLSLLFIVVIAVLA